MPLDCSGVRPVFHQIRQICHAYELPRCLDVEIWRFFVDNNDRTEYFTPAHVCGVINYANSGADPEGGFWGCNPPNGQSYNIKCSTTDVLSHGDALIYLAKSSGQVLSKL